MPTSAAASLSAAPGQIDMKAIKARQRGAWSSGDYAVVGTATAMSRSPLPGAGAM
jgi:hypothetical protein